MKRKIRHNASRLLPLKKRLNKYQQNKRMNRLAGRMMIYSANKADQQS